MSGVVKFDSGAVRSADRVGERYDLISPIGLEWLMHCRHKVVFNFAGSVEDEIKTAIQQCYAYLKGDRDYDHLAVAAWRVMAAIARTDEPDAKLLTATVLRCGMKRLATTCHEGAVKYGDYNWEKGMPVSEMLNHAIPHLLIALDGKSTEDDLGHALWNLFGAMHSDHLWPHLNKNLRGQGCVPPVV